MERTSTRFTVLGGTPPIQLDPQKLVEGSDSAAYASLTEVVPMDGTLRSDLIQWMLEAYLHCAMPGVPFAPFAVSWPKQNKLAFSRIQSCICPAFPWEAPGTTVPLLWFRPFSRGLRGLGEPSRPLLGPGDFHGPLTSP